jgi:hypothetical protein
VGDDIARLQWSFMPTCVLKDNCALTEIIVYNAAAKINAGYSASAAYKRNETVTLARTTLI